MKAPIVPIYFMSGFNKHVTLFVCRETDGELYLKSLSIGSVVYKSKQLTDGRRSAILDYASKFVDFDACILNHEYELKNSEL